MTRALNPRQLLLLSCTMLAGLILFTAAFFSIGSRGWYGKDSLNLKTSFLDIRGVDVGMRVRIQGMDAGEVVSIKAPENPGAPVVLGLKIQGSYKKLIRKDAVVSIASEGLLGAKVLELFPGSPSSLSAENQDLIASKHTPEISDILAEVSDMVVKFARVKVPWES